METLSPKTPVETKTFFQRLMEAGSDEERLQILAESDELGFPELETEQSKETKQSWKGGY